MIACQLTDENGDLGIVQFDIVPVTGDFVVVEDRRYLVAARTITSDRKIILLLKQQNTTDPQAMPNSSILDMAGAFKDDPFFDEFVEAMAANRRELDAEVNAWLGAEKNNQEKPKNTSD